MKEYWMNIVSSVRTLKKGLKITGKHMLDARKQRTPIGPDDKNYFNEQNGIFTLQYPKEEIPVPDNGRYKLHNEIEDCIVCDKCAKICPVNCIDIEPIRSAEVFGKTSDGTPLRIHAAKFDIDMAKCCFCGLCTTVCPTECLTMTNEYDFSAFDFEEHNVPFSNMTPIEILERKKAFEEHMEKKAAEKAKTATSTSSKPAMKPSIKPKVPGAAKPVMKPKVPGSGTAKPKVIVKPKIQVKKDSENSPKTSKPRPVIRPKIQVKKSDNTEEQESAKLKPKVPMRSKIPTPKKNKPEGEE